MSKSLSYSKFATQKKTCPGHDINAKIMTDIHIKYMPTLQHLKVKLECSGPRAWEPKIEYFKV